jgi:hypothetical protein
MQCRRCLPSPHPLWLHYPLKPNKRHLAESQNNIMERLPTELWIIILDMVIEEGIVRMDQGDHNTFPYDHVFLSPGKDYSRFYGAHHRLRLVCRSFNALLGPQPHCNLDPSIFPFPMGIRALSIRSVNGILDPVFQQLLADTRRCGRLVCLEVCYWLSTGSTQPSLLELFSAGEEGAFPNVQRLTIWIVMTQEKHLELPFWTRLHQGFPQLVTLSVVKSLGWVNMEGEPDKVITFERLETLFFDGGIRWSGCRFPRLRHASVDMVLTSFQLEIFQRSSHLECLLIRSVCPSIDVRSFSRLRVLAVSEHRLREVVPLDCDHPLEHLWLYSSDVARNPGLIDEIMKKLPRILRITMDLSSATLDLRTQRIQEFREMRLDSFGLALRPVKLSDTLLIIE